MEKQTQIRGTEAAPALQPLLLSLPERGSRFHPANAATVGSLRAMAAR